MRLLQQVQSPCGGIPRCVGNQDEVEQNIQGAQVKQNKRLACCLHSWTLLLV